MFKRHTSHSELIFDYGILIFLLAVAALLIRAFGFHTSTILIVTIPVSVGYIIWGVVHHLRHGHIDKKILLEYVLLAILVNVVIATLVI